MTGPSLLGPDHLDDLRRLARDAPPGDFMEVGVFQGGSARVLYEIAQQQGRTLHLFDTFTGHPPGDPDHDDLACHPDGRFHEAAATLPALRTALPHAQFYVGIFPDTWPGNLRLAFVHADTDRWHSTHAICTLLPPHLVPGGIILFDDYPFAGCRGVKEAVDAVLGPTGRVTLRATDKACYRAP